MVCRSNAKNMGAGFLMVNVQVLFQPTQNGKFTGRMATSLGLYFDHGQRGSQLPYGVAMDAFIKEHGADLGCCFLPSRVDVDFDQAVLLASYCKKSILEMESIAPVKHPVLDSLDIVKLRSLSNDQPICLLAGIPYYLDLHLGKTEVFNINLGQLLGLGGLLE